MALRHRLTINVTDLRGPTDTVLNGADVRLPARRDAIMDVGGYVAGHVKDGRRKVGHVLCRSMRTLDMDNGLPLS